jgi:curved DNA-binding protein CbpA
MAGHSDRGPDPYHVLGVAAGASGAEIARAYRQLARGLHPDARPVGPDAADQFRAVCDAYALLSDPAQRAAWDQRHAPPRPDPTGWDARPVPPLRAGPVHIQPPAPAAAAAPARDDPGELGLLLARLARRLESWPW